MTNNEKVFDFYKESFDVKFIDGDIISVFIDARDLVHKGDKILSHPLYGSIKPNETPYRTMLLEKGNSKNIDFQSLEIIENSIMTADKFIKTGLKFDINNEREMADFATVDLDLIKSSL